MLSPLKLLQLKSGNVGAFSNKDAKKGLHVQLI